MNSNVIMGVVRAWLPSIVAYLVGKGVIPADSGGDVLAALTAFATAGWSVYTNWGETSPPATPPKS